MKNRPRRALPCLGLFRVEFCSGVGKMLENMRVASIFASQGVGSASLVRDFVGLRLDGRRVI